MSEPVRVEARRDVDAPAATVYRILADYREHHPRILPKPTFESLVVEKGGVGEGTQARVTMKVLGTRTALTLRVREPEPGAVLEEELVESGGVTTFRVEPLDGGKRSRVTIATTWPRRPGLRGWMEARINARVAKPLYEKELAQLEAYAQSL